MCSEVFPQNAINTFTVLILLLLLHGFSPQLHLQTSNKTLKPENTLQILIETGFIGNPLEDRFISVNTWWWTCFIFVIVYNLCTSSPVLSAFWKKKHKQTPGSPLKIKLKLLDLHTLKSNFIKQNHKEPVKEYNQVHLLKICSLLFILYVYSGTFNKHGTLDVTIKILQLYWVINDKLKFCSLAFKINVYGRQLLLLEFNAL